MAEQRTRKRRSEAAGLAAKRGQAPGTAVYSGAPREGAVPVHIVQYDAGHLDERTVRNPGEAFPLPGTGVTWLHVDGLHDLETVGALAHELGVHPLTLEDALDASTPPKIEPFDDHVYISLRAAVPIEGAGRFELQHLSILFGPGWVLTLRDGPNDLFDGLMKRIRTGAGRVRRMGADYLAHAVMDAVVDAMFVVLQGYEELALDLEEEALERPRDDAPKRIHRIKMRLNQVRRAVWPLQTVVAELTRQDTTLVHKNTRPFFRDLADHVRQAADIVDSTRDRLTSAMELHLALVSLRMNEVMRVLTIVATIFIPLTFIAGVYGMNFSWMPELQARWGYPAVMVIMAGVAAVMVAWFRRREWL